MKKLMAGLLLIVSTILLVSCAGSKAIQKSWKAEDASKSSYTLDIKENEIVLSGNNEVESLNYEQNAIGTKNGIKYYGLLINKEQFSIIFPDKDNQGIALFLKTTDNDDYLNGTLIYAMNTKEKPDYAEYGEKFFH